MLVMGILYSGPLTEVLRFNHNPIIVNLVTASNHDMEWTELVIVEYISPHGVGPREKIGIDRHAEAIAGMEHDVHGLSPTGHPEALRWTTVYSVSNVLLSVIQLNLETKAPKSDISDRICIEPHSTNFLVSSQAFAILIKRSFVGGCCGRSVSFGRVKGTW